MPTLDEFAEQVGRRHADRVAAVLDQFEVEAWQDILNAGAATLNTAVGKFAALLRETTPDCDAAKLCKLVREGYSTQLGMWLMPAQGRA